MSRRETRGGDTPFLAWGEELRRSKALHRRHVQRRITSCATVAILLLANPFRPAPRLVWNASASAPVGLYLVSPQAPIRRGDMVVANLPEPWRTLAAQRHYLPVNVPLVKRVAAVQGDLICGRADQIFINGPSVAARLRIDGRGRFLPHWEGCRTLGPEQYLLLMDNPASFDGRYFGPTGGAQIIGRARLLWAR
ncbi:MAG TPA: S26 family signal peptidase [Sphingobium sp.]|uniref:S26 family signal peptidase n=1 Tax=Sphingobium sp. TaxID=1912891 RepID=UPI002ED4752D